MHVSQNLCTGSINYSGLRLCSCHACILVLSRRWHGRTRNIPIPTLMYSCGDKPVNLRKCGRVKHVVEDEVGGLLSIHSRQREGSGTVLPEKNTNFVHWSETEGEERAKEKIRFLVELNYGTKKGCTWFSSRKNKKKLEEDVCFKSAIPRPTGTSNKKRCYFFQM